MKKLLLLSLLFIGCGPSGPMPSDIPLLELPTDEMLENWANKIDSVFAPENFKDYTMKIFKILILFIFFEP